MSDSTFVTFGALDAGAEAISGNHGALRNTLDQMDSDLKPMVNHWTGEAATDYGIQKAKWDSAADQMTAALLAMSKAVSEANAGYRATEAANAKRWGG
jgi:ESAT-6 family protein